MLEASLVGFIALDSDWEKVLTFLFPYVIYGHSCTSSHLCPSFEAYSLLLSLQDIPLDPTGKLDELRIFIEDNIDICTWVGITVLVVQVFSLHVAVLVLVSVFFPDLSLVNEL